LIRDFFVDNFEHVLAALIFIAWAGDNISTRLVTPTMKLEANPLAKRFPRIITWFGLLVCALPYFSTPLAVMVVAPWLLVVAANFGQGWTARVLGEAETLELFKRAVARGSLRSALAMTAAHAAFLALAGFLLIFLSEGPRSWGYWFALGLLLYAFGKALHTTIFYVRAFRSRTLGASTESA